MTAGGPKLFLAWIGYPLAVLLLVWFIADSESSTTLLLNTGESVAEGVGDGICNWKGGEGEAFEDACTDNPEPVRRDEPVDRFEPPPPPQESSTGPTDCESNDTRICGLSPTLADGGAAEEERLEELWAEAQASINQDGAGK